MAQEGGGEGQAMSVEGGTEVAVGKEGAALQPAWRRWTRGLGFAFVSLVVLALAATLTFGMLNRGEGESGLMRLNMDAPDFTLNLFDGGTFTLSEKRGQPVVMNIWASWCHTCRDEAPALEEGWRAFRDQGVVFVGVNVQDTRGDALAFIEEFDVTYPNGPDESDIYFQYGATGHPETLFINRDGKIILKYLGPLNREQVTAFTEELLK